MIMRDIHINLIAMVIGMKWNSSTLLHNIEYVTSNIRTILICLILFLVYDQ